MLKDQVILVTGSNEGIGFAIAQLCHQYGAKVILHGLDSEQLEKSANRIAPDVSYITADLRNSEAPQKIIDFVINKYGRIDGLVNNAGRLDRSTIESIDNDIFDELMIINTRAPIMLIKAALPHMEKQSDGGSIVNIGSVHAHGGDAKVLLYSMTKAALMTATRNLGDALSERLVRVNQMNVGWTETENEHKIQASEGKPENWLENIPKSHAPTGKILTPLQVAEHAAFWLSKRSAPVTGQVVDIEQYPIIGRV